MQHLVVVVEKALQSKMWKHYCPIEESDIRIGKGEECNWCGAVENNDWDKLFGGEKLKSNIEKDYRNDNSSS